MEASFRIIGRHANETECNINSRIRSAHSAFPCDERFCVCKDHHANDNFNTNLSTAYKLLSACHDKDEDGYGDDYGNDCEDDHVDDECRRISTRISVSNSNNDDDNDRNDSDDHDHDNDSDFSSLVRKINCYLILWKK